MIRREPLPSAQSAIEQTASAPAPAVALSIDTRTIEPHSPLELWTIWQTHLATLMSAYQSSADMFISACIETRQSLQRDYPDIWEKRGLILDTFYRADEWKFTFGVPGQRYCFDDKNRATESLIAITLFLDLKEIPTLDETCNPETHEKTYQICLSNEQHYSIQRLCPKYRLTKTIRFDEYCFADDCFAAITPYKGADTRKAVRIGAHKKYTVYHNGVFRYDKKPTYRYTDTEKLKKEQLLSKSNATSLVDIQGNTPVFGHSKDRHEKLVGLWLDVNDAVINRIYRYDGGTISRPYEHHNEQDARKYLERVKNPRDPKLVPSIQDLTTHMDRDALSTDTTRTPKYNEILASIRWNELTSAIKIFSDTFEARCIAQMYAETERERLAMRYDVLGIPFPDQYQIPIGYFIPGHTKKHCAYTAKQQAADQQHAMIIFNNEKEREKKFALSNYEFLGLIDDTQSVLEMTYHGLPILFWLVNEGFIYLADYILKKSHDAPSLETYLIENEFSKKILASTKETREQFHRRSKAFTAAIARDRAELLDQFFAANLPYQDASMGNTLLHTATTFGKINCVKKLLARHEIDVNGINDAGKSPLYIAVSQGHVEMVRILIKHDQINICQEIRENDTPLSLAFFLNHIEIATILLAEIVHFSAEIRQQALNIMNIMIHERDLHSTRDDYYLDPMYQLLLKYVRKLSYEVTFSKKHPDYFSMRPADKIQWCCQWYANSSLLSNGHLFHKANKSFACEIISKIREEGATKTVLLSLIAEYRKLSINPNGTFAHLLEVIELYAQSERLPDSHTIDVAQAVDPSTSALRGVR